MNYTALTSQDSNRPRSIVFDDNFSESLNNVESKIRSLQNELQSITSKTKKSRKLSKTPSKAFFTSKDKPDIYSKENLDYTLTKSNKKSHRTPRVHVKPPESTSRTFIESTLDQAQNCQNIETQESDEGDIIVQDIKEKLERIFEYYSRFGDKGSPFQLRLSKYRKMMTDSGLIDSSTLLEELEVLFLGHNQHKTTMEFEGFLKLLPKIACIRYPLSSYTLNQSLNLLLSRYILPLNNHIESASELYSEAGYTTTRDDPVEEGVLIVLKSVYSTLLKIYKEFFMWETKGIENPVLLAQHNENGFWSFLKEFEICPGMITKAMGQSLWAQRDKTKSLFSTMGEDSEVNGWFKKKDIGQSFKFTKFCEMLVNLSFMVEKKQGDSSQVHLNEAEQMASLLGKLEYSRGMGKFALRGNLIVPKETLEKVVAKRSKFSEKAWLCQAEEQQVVEPEKFSSVMREDKENIGEMGRQRSKKAMEIYNRIVSQRGEGDM